MPNGQWIYFNSERTGHMQIWRMHPDGSNQEQVITGETNDWFPHISPDGKWMTFLSYQKCVTGHLPDKDVTLNLMSLTDKSVKTLAKLFSEQGTNNPARRFQSSASRNRLSARAQVTGTGWVLRELG